MMTKLAILLVALAALPACKTSAVAEVQLLVDGQVVADVRFDGSDFAATTTEGAEIRAAIRKKPHGVPLYGPLSIDAGAQFYASIEREETTNVLPFWALDLYFPELD